MKILAVILAVGLALFGFRLISAGLKAIIMLLKVEQVPPKAKATIYRDFIMGILLIILAVFIIT